MTAVVSTVGVGALLETTNTPPSTNVLVKEGTDPVFEGDSAKPVIAVPAMGLVPTSPHTSDPDVVVTPDLLKMAKLPAVPRSTASKADARAKFAARKTNERTSFIILLLFLYCCFRWQAEKAQGGKSMKKTAIVVNQRKRSRKLTKTSVINHREIS